MNLNSEEKLFYIIDGHALMYRSFYAIRSLSNAQGMPTNALYGFVKMILKIKRENQPSHMAVALDSPGKKKRKDLFPEYKANRDAMPDDLRSQMDRLKVLLELFKIPFFEDSAHEADDIIASLVHKIPQNTMKTVIVTGDKDLFQLLKENVLLWNIHEGTDLYDCQKAFDKYGFDPSYIADFLALVGDSSDNIPGVPGIGAKTATRYIARWGSLEDILAQISDKPQNAQQKKIMNHADLARMNRKLTELVCDLTVCDTLDECLVQKENEKALWKEFRELEFFQIIKEMGLKNDEEGLSIFAQNLEKLQKVEKEGLEAFVDSVDLTSPHAFWQENGQIFLKKISSKEIFYGKALSQKDLKTLLSLDLVWVGYEWKALLRTLELFDREEHFIDLKLAHYLLDSESSHQLIRLLQKYVDPLWSKDDTLTPEESLLSLDCLYDIFLKKLSNENMEQLFFEMEVPLMSLLAKIEHIGVKVDVKLLNTLSEKLSLRLDKLSSQIYDESGMDFNINSPKQLGHVLFDCLRFPFSKKTKTGYSTATDVLQKLAVDHHLPRLILEYRHIHKLKTTYIDALPLGIDPRSNRIHTTLHQDKVSTGRLSSSDPNLQNIPIKTPEGREIRRAIIASSSEHLLLSADYSQIELKVLAHLSKDEVMLKAFRDGLDIHKQTASQIMNIDQDSVSEEMRRVAKAINFSLIYGKTPFGLSKDLGISLFQAKAFIESYFEHFPRIRNFMEESIAEARENGSVRTLYGRVRFVPQINDKNKMLRQFSERIAINSRVQGTAADIIKKSMLSVDRFLRKKELKTQIILQIHDEILLDLPKDELKVVKKEIPILMEKSVELDIPLSVNVGAASSWADAH